MKSLTNYLFESEGAQFKYIDKISKKEFDTWKKNHESEYDIVYSEADRLYVIYSVKDKSNPVWKGEHVATYDCRSGKFYYDNKEIL